VETAGEGRGEEPEEKVAKVGEVMEEVPPPRLSGRV
jgi:hypothetical protein